jgi:hypothetical protein
MVEFIHCELGTVDLLKTSGEDPGWDPDFFPSSRIQQQKRGEGKLFFLPSFSHKFHKIKNSFYAIDQKFLT